MGFPALPLALVTAALQTAAADQATPVRAFQLEERGQFLTMTVGMPDVVDDRLRRRLSSGFASTIVVRAYLYREGEARPIGGVPQTIRIAYDLWDEVFDVRTVDPRGERNLKLKTEGEALAQITKLEAFPLAPLEALRPGVRHFVAVLVEVNPITPENLAQIRRWLARSRGGERLSGPESFFGSFFSIFLNQKVSEAERIVRFRSQAFQRSEVRK